jgi:hypothetical protein
MLIGIHRRDTMLIISDVILICHLLSLRSGVFKEETQNI